MFGNLPVVGGVGNLIGQGITALGQAVSGVAGQPVYFPGTGGGGVGLGADISNMFAPTPYAQGSSTSGGNTGNLPWTGSTSGTGGTQPGGSMAGTQGYTISNSPPSGGGGGGGNNGSSIIPQGQAGSGMTYDQYAADQAYRAQKAAYEQWYNQQISSLYQPALNSLTAAEGTAKTNQETGISNVEKQGKDFTTSVQGENTAGQQQLANQGTQVDTSRQGALDQSVRYINALLQQGLGAFGLGSSGGEAMTALAQQEGARQIGGINQNWQNAQDQLAVQKTNLNNYITDKTNQIQDWVNNQKLTINQTYGKAMQDIANNRTLVEGNKTNAQIAALQQAMTNLDQVNQAQRTFTNNLAGWYIQEQAKLQGTNFTPADVANAYQQITSKLAGAQGVMAPPIVAANPMLMRAGGNNQDILSQMVNPFATNTGQ